MAVKESQKEQISIGDELYNLIAITEGDEPLEPEDTCANDERSYLEQEETASAVRKLLKN